MRNDSFIDNIDVSLNFDYRQTDEQGYVNNRIHTGIDIQGRVSDTRIGSIAKGIVVGIDDAFGGVVVESIINDDEVVQISHLHLANIPDNIEVGSSVEIGQFIGFEGRTGLSSSSGKHLHIEIRDVCMTPSSSLSTLPMSLTWDNAKDPLSYAQHLINNASDEYTHGTIFNIVIPEIITFGDKSYLKGCVYSPEKLNGYVNFLIKNDNEDIALQEQYLPSTANNETTIKFGQYFFGEEDELKQSGDYSLKVTVTDRQDLSLEYSKIYEFSVIGEQVIVDSFDITLPDTAFQNHGLNFEGCIYNQEGIEKITIKTVQPNMTIVKETKESPELSLCKGVENSVNMSNYYVNRPGRPEGGFYQSGQYTVSVETTNESGLIILSETLEYTAITPVKAIETPNGLKAGNVLNDFVVHRVTPPDPNKIVNLPGCMDIEVGGKVCNSQFKLEQNPDDFGLYRAEVSCALDLTTGTYNFTLFNQCASSLPRMILLEGELTFN